MIEKNEYEMANLADYGYKDYGAAKKAYAVIIKIISVLAIFALYIPIILIAISSVNSSKDIFTFENITFDWYLNMFSNRSLTRAITNTLMVSLIAVTLATIFGTLIAIGINSLSSKNRKLITILNSIPILNADIVTGLSLMIIFSILLPVFPYVFGFPTLVLAHMFFTMPYVILSVLPKLRELDPNLIDAANDLGVKPLKTVYKVIIPAIKAGILSGLLLAFTMSIDDFIISFFTSGNGYDNLSIWIYSSIGKKSLNPSVYAFSTVLIIVILVGLLLFTYIKSHRKKLLEKRKVK